MKFSQIKPGELFEFDHSDLPAHIARGMLQGPWHKITARKYLDPETGKEYVVGSTSVKVVLIEPLRENPAREKRKQATKRKASPRQIAARKLFAKRAKAGEFSKTAKPKRARKSVARKTASRVPVISAVDNPSDGLSGKYGREEIVQQAQMLSNLLNRSLVVHYDKHGGRYQIRIANLPKHEAAVSAYLTPAQMRTWMHGAISTASKLK